MHFSFQAKLWKWPGDMGWYFVSVPKVHFEAIRARVGKGLVRVTCRTGETSWQTSLLPHNQSGTYLIAIKVSVRKKEELFEGDEVEFSFKIIKNPERIHKI